MSESRPETNPREPGSQTDNTNSHFHPIGSRNATPRHTSLRIMSLMCLIESRQRFDWVLDAAPRDICKQHLFERAQDKQNCTETAMFCFQKMAPKSASPPDSKTGKLPASFQAQRGAMIDHLTKLGLGWCNLRMAILFADAAAISRSKRQATQWGATPPALLHQPAVLLSTCTSMLPPSIVWYIISVFALSQNYRTQHRLQNHLKEMRILFLDDMSMIGRQSMRRIDSRLNRAKAGLNPTGASLLGVSSILSGDPAQCEAISDQQPYDTCSRRDTASAGESKKSYSADRWSCHILRSWPCRYTVQYSSLNTAWRSRNRWTASIQWSMCATRSTSTSIARHDVYSWRLFLHLQT